MASRMLRLRPPPVIAQPRRRFARRPALFNFVPTARMAHACRTPRSALRMEGIGEGAGRGGRRGLLRACCPPHGFHPMRANHQMTAGGCRSPSSARPQLNAVRGSLTLAVRGAPRAHGSRSPWDRENRVGGLTGGNGTMGMEAAGGGRRSAERGHAGGEVSRSRLVALRAPHRSRSRGPGVGRCGWSGLGREEAGWVYVGSMGVESHSTPRV
jgi:hypothetical protein